MAFWSRQAPPPTSRPAAPIRQGYFPPINQPGSTRAGQTVDPFVVTPVDVSKSNRVLAGGRYAEFPTVDQWASEVNIYLRPGGQIHALVAQRMAFLLSVYHNPNSNLKKEKRSFERLYVLQDMFKLLDDALKPGTNATSYELAIVGDMYKLVVARLCQFFNVSVNMLPQKLWAFDAGLQEQDRNQVKRAVRLVHQNDGELYLSAVDLESYKLDIQRGLIRQWDTRDGGASWNLETFDTAILSRFLALPNEFRDTAVITDARGNQVDLTGSPSRAETRIDRAEEAGEAGYVFAVWEEMYSALHEIGRFHSQYTAAHPILCAGTLIVRDGKLLRLTNFSGHYQPGRYQLLPVLWFLNRRGVDLTQVKIAAQISASRVVVSSGQQYLASGGSDVRYQFDLAPRLV